MLGLDKDGSGSITFDEFFYVIEKSLFKRERSIDPKLILDQKGADEQEAAQVKILETIADEILQTIDFQEDKQVPALNSYSALGQYMRHHSSAMSNLVGMKGQAVRIARMIGKQIANATGKGEEADLLAQGDESSEESVRVKNGAVENKEVARGL